MRKEAVRRRWSSQLLAVGCAVLLVMACAPTSPEPFRRTSAPAQAAAASLVPPATTTSGAATSAPPSATPPSPPPTEPELVPYKPIRTSVGSVWSTLLLPDGRVMITGDAYNSADDLTHWSLFDPTTDTIAAEGSLPADYGPAGDALPDGRVAFDGTDGSALILDPQTGRTSASSHLHGERPVGTPIGMPSGMAGGISVELVDGRVLTAGGPRMTCVGEGVCDGPTASAFVRTAEIYDPDTDKTRRTGSMLTRRRTAAAVLLRDRRVLVAGGDLGFWNDDPGPHVVLAAAEIYDPRTGRFTRTGSLHQARTGASAILLRDGRVLIAGGHPDGLSERCTATAEIFDPATGRFASTGSMTAPGCEAVATVLADGRVLLTGGEWSELFDPSSGQFSRVNLPVSCGWCLPVVLRDGRVVIAEDQQVLLVYAPDGLPRTDPGGPSVAQWGPWPPETPSPPQAPAPAGQSIHVEMVVDRSAWDGFPFDAVQLDDGRVMVIGGEDVADLPTLGGPTFEYFDAATNTFRLGGRLPTDISVDPTVATTLTDGRVFFVDHDHTATIFDPHDGSFTKAGRMVHAHFYDTAILLSDGRVLLTGGSAGDGYIRDAELFDPATGTFVATGSMTTGRENARAIRLADGRVLVLGGDRGSPEDRWAAVPVPALASAEVFDPTTGQFSAVGSMHDARTNFATSLLADGEVLVAGGTGADASELDTGELFDPATGQFGQVGRMYERRSGPALIPMAGGQVLVVGGQSAEKAEIYDAARRVFVADDLDNFDVHAAFMLRDGRILLLAAGSADVYSPPAPAPSLTPSATPVPPSTLPPYVDMPVVSVPGWSPVAVEVHSSKRKPPVVGPFYYDDGLNNGDLDVTDIGTGSVRTIRLPLRKNEVSSALDANQRWLVVEADKGVESCEGEGPGVAWRLLVASLGADGLPRKAFRAVAAGCTQAFELSGALSGSRLAYAPPADVWQSGSTVVVVNLQADGSGVPVAKYPAHWQVVDVAASSEAVAWIESANGTSNRGMRGWAVKLARDGDPAPSEVNVGDHGAKSYPESFALDGTAVVASLSSPTFPSEPVVRSDGGSVSVVAPVAPGRTCTALGTAGTHVVLECYGSEYEWLAVWSSWGGLRAIGVDGAPVTDDGAWIVGGRLIWEDLTSGADVYNSVPLSVLGGLP